MSIDERYEQVLQEYKNYINNWIDKQGSEELSQHARVEKLLNISQPGRHEMKIRYMGVDGNCYEYWETATKEGLSVYDDDFCEEEE